MDWEKLIYQDGESYEGAFRDNLFSGDGVFTLKNGDYYEGQFVNGQASGKGCYEWKDGSKYSGTLPRER